MTNYNADKEAKLYYLFMMADGEISYSEEKLFDKLCKELDISGDTKKDIEQNCKELYKNKKDIFSLIVSERVVEAVENDWLEVAKHNKRLATVIWNLINLGYADAVYSIEEKRIVDYLVAKWNISTEIYQEIVDTSDTILALTKQKEWISRIFTMGSEKDKRDKEIDKDIEKLVDNIKLSIDEIAM